MKNKKVKKGTEKRETYELIIAEKPQAAMKIAYALADVAPVKKNYLSVPYYEVRHDDKKVIVASAVGHVFTLTSKQKKQGIPIFNIGWVPSYEVNKTSFYVKKYINTLKKLKPTGITIACDYDIEGELIGYNILRFVYKQEKAKRMKFSTLTKSELLNSYKNRMEHIDFGQAVAGETRHMLDWFYGINLSRALIQAVKSIGRYKLLSIGRVQGPALAIVAQREHEIINFKPVTYWKAWLDVSDREKKVRLESGKITEEEKDKLDKLRIKGKSIKLDIKHDKVSVKPFPPFDLTTLQIEAYKFFKISPAKTLSIAQKLYLAGLISYPRTSSQKLPASIGYKSIIQKLSELPAYKNLVKAARKDKPIEGKAVDSAHPAIYPTGNFSKLEGGEQKVYDLIVKRFLACFANDAKISITKIKAKINNIKFKADGKHIIEKGWLEVYPYKVNEKSLVIDPNATISDITLEEKQTEPPRRYTPASLVNELSKRELGTKSTRAMIIETLYKRNYIKENSIKVTELGMSMIKTLEKFSPSIIDETLTRKFEQQLEKIRQNKKPVELQHKILNQAKTIIKKITSDIEVKKKDIGKLLIEAEYKRQKTAIKDNTLVKCPLCGGNIIIRYNKRGKRFLACTNYPKCKAAFSLQQKGLIKPSGRTCSVCGWPTLRLIMGRRAFEFCFNPECKENWLVKFKQKLKQGKIKKAVKK